MISLLLLTLLTTSRVGGSLTSDEDNSIDSFLLNNMDFLMPENRLLFGNETEPNAWPWTVQLVYKKSFRCGGALISNSFVVTAAHCVPSRLSDDFVVLSGGHKIMSGQAHKALKIVPHPLYNSFFYLYDIAIIKISPEVTFGERVQSISLPERLPLDYEMCTVTGWGRKEDRRLSKSLRQIQVPILPVYLCNIKYLGRVFPWVMLCAGYREGGMDSCQGDSGGPLMCEREGKWELQGVVSWGNGCGQPGYPGIYASIMSVLPWLKLMMQLHR